MPVPLHWHNEPLLLFCLLFAGWVYALGTGPLRARLAPPGSPYPMGRALAYYSGLVVAYLAVGSPIDQFGEDYLFSVHMFQHLLIVYAAPPLLLWGTPWWLADAVLRVHWVRKIVKPLVHPAMCCLSFVLIFSLWHLPELYEAALRNRMIHIFEHFTIFLTALQMWWLFLSPSRILPPCSPILRIVCSFLLTIGHMPVFGLLMFTTNPLYRTYELAPRIVPGLDALQDQVLGGTIMELVAVAFSLSLLAWSFWSWLRDDEIRGDKAARAALGKPAATEPAALVQAAMKTGE